MVKNNHIWDKNKDVNNSLCGIYIIDHKSEFCWYPGINFMPFVDCNKCIELTRHIANKEIRIFFKNKHYNKDINLLLNEEN